MESMLHLFRFAANACGTKTGTLPSLYDGIPCDAAGNLDVQSMEVILTFVGNVVRILIAASGAIAMIIIVVSAIYYIISAGDPGSVKKARDILNNAILGLVLISVAYAIVTFIAKGF